MAQVDVTVSIDDEHLAAIGEVTEQLRASGLLVREVLPDLGFVTGSVPAERRPSLNAVPGVADVTEELRVQLPPPDAPVQ